MPIYEFECTKCNKQFEEIILQPSEPAPKCPDCGCEKVQKLLSTGNIRAKGIARGKGGYTPPPSCAPGGG